MPNSSVSKKIFRLNNSQNRKKYLYKSIEGKVETNIFLTVRQNNFGNKIPFVVVQSFDANMSFKINIFVLDVTFKFKVDFKKYICKFAVQKAGANAQLAGWLEINSICGILLLNGLRIRYHKEPPRYSN